MPRPRDNIRDFPGKRWLNVGLRTLHVCGIILLGASLTTTVPPLLAVLLTVISGGLMFAIDLWANPGHIRETAGFGVVVKLLLVGGMALQPAWAAPLFWLTVVLSTLLSHAPGGFRHRQLF